MSPASTLAEPEVGSLSMETDTGSPFGSVHVAGTVTAVSYAVAAEIGAHTGGRSTLRCARAPAAV